MKRHLKKYGLAYVIVALFLVSLIGQFVFQSFEFVHDANDHGEHLQVWTQAWDYPEFWQEFGRAVTENWQSEWLQVATFVIATAYLSFTGSAESADSEERMEAKIDALAERMGLDPAEIEKQLPERHQR
jgi:hypothetical protein